MNKKILLYSICLLVGLGLGFAFSQNDNLSLHPKRELPALSPPSLPKQGSRQNKKADMVHSFPQRSLAWNNPRDIKRLFDTYAGLSPDAIKQELNRILQETAAISSTYDKDFDNAYLIIQYLLYLWGKQAPREALQYDKLRDIRHMNDLIFARVGYGGIRLEAEPADSLIKEDSPLDESMQKILKKHPDSVQSFALKFPEKAISWFLTLSDEEKNNCGSYLLSGVAQSKPRLLNEHQALTEQIIAGQGEDKSFNNSLVLNIARAGACSDWKETKKWILTLPDKLGQKALIESLTVLARTSPETAKIEFSQLSGTERQQAAKSITQTLPSPMEALTWLQKNLSGAEISDVFKKANISLFPDESKDLCSYLSRMPEDPFKEEALSYFIRLKTHKGQIHSAFYREEAPISFEDTVSLIEQLPSAEQRQSLLKESILTYPDRDQSLQWLKKNHFSPQEKEKWENAIREKQRTGEKMSGSIPADEIENIINEK